jgi:hypothetical protein
VVDGEQGGISENFNWRGGGGFRFYRLGEPAFDAEGRIRDGIRFPVLAAHVWFSETGTPWNGKGKSPLLGFHGDRAFALLYNGILGDKTPKGGGDLSPWHDLREWQAKASRRKKNPGVTFNARQKSIAYMAMMAKGTVGRSNGRQVLRTVKNKDLRIPENQLEPYLAALLEAQERLCAITGLQLQYHGDEVKAQSS